jgi:hypothetical protein
MFLAAMFLTLPEAATLYFFDFNCVRMSRVVSMVFVHPRYDDNGVGNGQYLKGVKTPCAELTKAVTLNVMQFKRILVQLAGYT